jgi:divalent metal cation (Fe/Co/Zn/Cd) transporter
VHTPCRALLVAVATIFLWPLAAVMLLYVIYRVFDIHPELLTYIALFVGVIAIATVWWWHVVRHNNPKRDRRARCKILI